MPGISLDIVRILHPCGIVLTGGNSLCKYGGNAPERDENEHTLIDYAVQNNIPLYGLCRGMQVILDYFGIELENVAFHAATSEDGVVEAVRHKKLPI